MFPPVPPPEDPKPREPRHTAPRLNVKQAKTNVCLVIAITMMAIVLLSLVLVGAVIFGVLRMPATSDGEPPPDLPRIQRQTTTTKTTAGAITLETLDEVAQVQEIREGKLSTIAHAPSEPLLAIGMGQSIWLYNQQTMDMVYTLQGHTEDINTLVFAPQRNEDGELLLAASAVDDPYVLLWDVDRGQVVGELDGHNGWIRSLAWSNDGSMIATAATDRTIKLWDVDTLELLHTLEGHTDMVSDVAFSADNRMLVSTSRDGSVRLWDTRNGSERKISQGEGDGEGDGEGERVFFNILSDTAPANAASSVTPLWTTGVEFSPDGTQVAVGSTDNIVRILSTDDGSLVHRLEGHAGLIVIQGIAYSPDGTLLASASVDGTVRLWDTQTGKLTKTLDHRGGQVLGIAWYPDGQSLVSISDTRGEVIVWDVAAGVPALRLPLAQGPLLSLAYSPDGKILGTSGSNGTVRLHIFDDGQKVTLSDAAQSYQAIGFLANTSIALATQSATPSEAGDVAIMNLLRQSDPQIIGDIAGAALSVATDPGNALLAIGSSTGEIVLWDGLGNEQVATLRGADSSITRLAFGNGGALLASGTGGGLATTTNDRAIVTVWDVAQGEQLYQLMDKPGGEDGVILTGLAMQPTGTLVAATSEDGELIVWDAADGSELYRIEATETQGWFSCVTYSPDGSILVTGSPDGSIAFWDSHTMELAHTLEIGGGGVLAVTFRPDGQQLAVSVFHGGVRVFGQDGQIQP